MKKLLLAFVLNSASYVVPEWREHRGPLGWALNTAEGAVEAPVDIVSNGAQRSSSKNGPFHNNGYNKDGYNRKGRYNRRYDQRIRYEHQQTYNNNWDNSNWDNNY